jgi:hypothetical protein
LGARNPKYMPVFSFCFLTKPHINIVICWCFLIMKQVAQINVNLIMVM